MTDAASRIVWLASFPKSGNTWFRAFLANLAAGEAGPADINDLGADGGIASNRFEFESATFLDSGLLSHDDIDALRPQVYQMLAGEDREGQRWIKVHDAYTLTEDGTPLLGGAARAAIYLVRDPRDVAVSLAHHLGASIDDAIALMNNSRAAFCAGRKGQPLQLRQKLLGWSGHVESWLGQRDVPVHVVRYEDLHANPERHFAAALAFAGRQATPDGIARAVRHAAFVELQRQESEHGFFEGIPGNAPFFRAGRVGAWRETLTDDQVRAIEAAHRLTMERLGYGLA